MMHDRMIKRALFLLAPLALAADRRCPRWPPRAAEAPPSLFAGDLGNSLWTLLIFVLVLVILGKFAWGPILKTLQARESFIHEALAKAKADRDEAEARLKEYEERLATARAEATAIVEEGRRDAEVVKRKIEEDAKHEADKMIERAKREIQLATDAATKRALPALRQAGDRPRGARHRPRADGPGPRAPDRRGDRRHRARRRHRDASAH